MDSFFAENELNGFPPFHPVERSHLILLSLRGSRGIPHAESAMWDTLFTTLTELRRPDVTSPIVAAAACGRVDICELFMRKRTFPLLSLSGVSPLAAAAVCGRDAAVAALIRCGFPVDRSTVVAACVGGSVPVVQVLLRTAFPDGVRAPLERRLLRTAAVSGWDVTTSLSVMAHAQHAASAIVTLLQLPRRMARPAASPPPTPATPPSSPASSLSSTSFASAVSADCTTLPALAAGASAIVFEDALLATIVAGQRPACEVLLAAGLTPPPAALMAAVRLRRRDLCTVLLHYGVAPAARLLPDSDTSALELARARSQADLRRTLERFATQSLLKLPRSLSGVLLPRPAPRLPLPVSHMARHPAAVLSQAPGGLGDHREPLVAAAAGVPLVVTATTSAARHMARPAVRVAAVVAAAAAAGFAVSRQLSSQK